MGTASFYSGQTAGELIARFQADPRNPNLEYLSDDLPDDRMASLYAACDCLVAPYRGEGFGLPIAEAMACGLPVVVTGYGAALDFCDEANAYLLPACEVYFPSRRVGELGTVDYPWLAEPDVEALADTLRRVADDRAAARQLGSGGRQRVLERLTWDHAASAVEARLTQLAAQPPRLRGSMPRSDAPLHDPATPSITPTAISTGPARCPRPPDATARSGRRPLDQRTIGPRPPYEPFETELLLSQLGPGNVVLDLGGNIGYYTLLFARRVGPSGKVFAFEPDPDNFALLQENIESNGYENVVLVPKAAADRAGPARLYAAPITRATTASTTPTGHAPLSRSSPSLWTTSSPTIRAGSTW